MPDPSRRSVAKDYQRLWKDVTSTIDEAKAVRILAEILVDKEGRAFISRLERKHADLCIEILDHGIAEHDLKIVEKQAFFVTLRRLSGIHGRLPDSMVIPDEIEVGDTVLAAGGFADVRCGKYMERPVAVKTIRINVAVREDPDEIRKIRKQFCKEVVLWSTLSHPNVLRLVGVQEDMERGQFATVSEWMEHGNIMQFVKNNHVNRLELLYEAAQGLEYLHSANLVHGDLKGANILMSNGTPPRACLADFGFLTVVLNPGVQLSCSAELEGGTKAFMSPELLVPSEFGIKDSLPTPEGDTYAFGLVTFQVLTGEFPFRGYRDTELGWATLQGVRPIKPENASSIGFSDLLWSFVQRCWDGDMKVRPKVAEIVEHLGREATNWNGVMPPCVPAENVVSETKESISETFAYCKILTSGSDAVPKSPTESHATSGPFSRASTPSTLRSEPSQEGPQAVPTKPSEEPRHQLRLPMQPRSEGPDNDPHVPEIYPRPASRVPTPPRSEEPHDDLHLPEIYRHLGQRFTPPPSQLPQKKRKGFKHFKSKLRELFGWW